MNWYEEDEVAALRERERKGELTEQDRKDIAQRKEVIKMYEKIRKLGRNWPPQPVHML